MLLAQVTLFPEQASTLAVEVDHLFFFILGITVFFTTLIAVLVISFVIKFRRRSEADRPRQVHGGTRLEVAWTVIPLAVAMVVYLWSARVYVTWGQAPEGALEVYVVGRQWMWHLQHAGGQREINQLHVPVGRPVKLTITSQDVIHSVFVPEFRVHMDAVPGRYNVTWFEATRTGTFHLYCSQYCGTDHSRMIGQVVVLDAEAYERWLASKADNGLAVKGRKLFQKLQCVTCHSANAQARAPVLEGLYGSKVRLEGGGTVDAYEDYLRESILEPEAKIVAGYRPIMPSFKGIVDEEELVQLIAFLKALGPGETPPRVEQAEPPEARPAPAPKQSPQPAKGKK
jgi:cytochrome c oxidase subunit 2